MNFDKRNNQVKQGIEFSITLYSQLPPSHAHAHAHGHTHTHAHGHAHTHTHTHGQPLF